MWGSWFNDAAFAPLPAGLVAGALVVFVLLILILWIALGRDAVRMLPQLAALALLAVAGFYGIRLFDEANRIAERRLFEERAGLLLSQMVQPGSVLACIDGSPAPAMYEACEHTLFSEPQRVAAAVTVVKQRLAFVAEAVRFEADGQAGSGRADLVRASLEADPYGFVAYVLANEQGCTPESCAGLRLLRDPARVRENMRVRRFEAFMVKHAQVWRERTMPASPFAGIDLPPIPDSVMPGVSISERAPDVTRREFSPPRPLPPSADATESSPPVSSGGVMAPPLPRRPEQPNADR